MPGSHDPSRTLASFAEIELSKMQRITQIGEALKELIIDKDLRRYARVAPVGHARLSALCTPRFFDAL